MATLILKKSDLASVVEISGGEEHRVIGIKLTNGDIVRALSGVQIGIPAEEDDKTADARVAIDAPFSEEDTAKLKEGQDAVTVAEALPDDWKHKKADGGKDDEVEVQPMDEAIKP